MAEPATLQGPAHALHHFLKAIAPHVLYGKHDSSIHSILWAHLDVKYLST